MMFTPFLSGCAFYVVLAQRTAVHLYGDMMVWYHMFVIFVMYCMLPVPVKGRNPKEPSPLTEAPPPRKISILQRKCSSNIRARVEGAELLILNQPAS